MPVGRHRHAVNVRADGLAPVLGRLLQDAAVRAALLVDVDSGMVLDACVPQASRTDVDLEQLGAAHGDLMRLGLGPAVGVGPDRGPADCEIVISQAGGRHLVVRQIPDPFGDRLALSVLVDGSWWALRRTRARLREVSAAALTAGPTVTLRPVDGAWVPRALEERLDQHRPLPVADPGPAPVVTGQSDGEAARSAIHRPASPHSSIRPEAGGRPAGWFTPAAAAPPPAGSRPAPPSALPPRSPGADERPDSG